VNALLEVQDIHTYIGQFHILQGVSLTVPEGSVTALLGRNGAGKTTTLKSILGLTPPRSGKIIFAGKEIQGLRPYEIASLGIGYVPEHRAIFTNLTVEENLRIAERRKGELKRKADFIFSLFPDLKKLYKLPAGHLSGGQQQMLAIARALVPDNRLLLIDEPSEGLAPLLVRELMSAIRQLSSEVTILLVDQNFQMTSSLATYYTLIDDGRLVSSGLMSELLQEPETVRRYLGAVV
jgi:branched-chain amino acid transport system ATP-binding protein